LAAIVAYQKQFGMAPTIREIMEMTGETSTSTVSRYLADLRESGLITYRDGAARSIVVAANGAESPT